MKEENHQIAATLQRFSEQPVVWLSFIESVLK